MKKKSKKKAIVPESVNEHIEAKFRKSEDFRKAYVAQMAMLQIAYKIARLRKSRHLTQAQLAKRMKTTQQTISRLEDSTNTEITLSTLSKLAVALGARLNIDLLPKSA